MPPSTALFIWKILFLPVLHGLLFFLRADFLRAALRVLIFRVVPLALFREFYFELRALLGVELLLPRGQIPRGSVMAR